MAFQDYYLEYSTEISSTAITKYFAYLSRVEAGTWRPQSPM